MALIGLLIILFIGQTLITGRRLAHKDAGLL